MRTELLRYEHLLDFARRLAPSQGYYGRLLARLETLDDYEIDRLNDSLAAMHLTTDLMDILSVLEG